MPKISEFLYTQKSSISKKSTLTTGQVISYRTVYAVDRNFPIDMAGFAVKVSKLLETKILFSDDFRHGHLETDFLSLLLNIEDHATNSELRQGQVVNDYTKSQIQGLGPDCSEILVWHTKSVNRY